MFKQFSYTSPLSKQFFQVTHPEIWDKMMIAWEQEKYSEVIYGVFEYLGQPLSENEQKFPIHKQLTHGSVVLNFEVTESQINIEAPFLDISEAQVKPLFRQALQLNFEPLSLSKIALKGEHLCFYYQCPLNDCEPSKIYDALREICLHADNYDDTFIKRFHAKRILDPVIFPVSNEVADQAWHCFTTYLKECNDMLQMLEQKRMHTYMWDVLIITLMKIDSIIVPQGHLRSELERGISMLSGEGDLSEKIQRGRAFLASLEKISKEALTADLYTINMLVPYKTLAGGDTIKSKIVKAIEQAEGEMEEGDTMAACLTLNYHILNMLYYSTVESTYEKALLQTLVDSSGHSFQEAARILISGLRLLSTSIKATTRNFPQKQSFSTSKSHSKRIFN